MTRPERKVGWLLLLIMLIVSLAAEGDAEPWIGLHFTPQANTRNSHSLFLKDLEPFLLALKKVGVNTIVFDMNYGAFHFRWDAGLRRAPYAPNKGFTAPETRRMVSLARGNGMRVVVSFQVLTHSVGNIFPYVYPQYMIGASSNSDTRDPFSKPGEAIVFSMIDELINAFTVDGIRPDGFHIGCDELGSWYQNPEIEVGMTSAEIYAMAVTSVYRHIKTKYPTMEVIMWGDMLDPYWNGKADPKGRSGKNTASAVDLIPKDIVIADWRCGANPAYRHDSDKEIFPSVAEFLDKGFRVWPASWNEVRGGRDLVWTGNMEQGRTGRVLGHLYTTWLPGVVPELEGLLTNTGATTSDNALLGVKGAEKERHRRLYRQVADTLLLTAKLVGVEQCRGTDFNCGEYPRCENLSDKNGVYDGQYRRYYCNGNKTMHKVIPSPSDYEAFWKFDGDATDVTGRHDGRISAALKFVDDPERGVVARFTALGSQVKIKGSETLKRKDGGVTITVWFKAGSTPEDFGTLISNSADLRSYTLLLARDGRIVFETNGNFFYRYSANGTNYCDNKWHHVVAAFDRSIPVIDIYVDGIKVNGAEMNIKVGNDDSVDSNLVVGNNNGQGQYQFKGLIDDLAVYLRALSPDEAGTVYHLSMRKHKGLH